MAFELHDGPAFVAHLCSLEAETPWVEFKQNTFNAETVGKYVSGLANAAMLAHKQHAFMVWGISDGSHEVVGTSVRLANEKVGNADLLLWLTQQLRPKIILKIESIKIEGKTVDILAIEPGYQQPVSF